MQRLQLQKNGEIGESTRMAADENQKQKVSYLRSKGRKVHFASLMDLCHLKNSEVGPQRQSRTPR